MKIGMIVDNLSVSGGYQKLVLRLTKELEKFGHEVIIYTPIVNFKECYPKIISTCNIVTLSSEKESKNIIRKLFKSIFSYKIKIHDYNFLASKISSELDAIIIHNEITLLTFNKLNHHKNTKIFWMLNNQVNELLYENIFLVKVKEIMKINDIRNLIFFLFSFVSDILIKANIKKNLIFVESFLTYDSFNKKVLEKKLNIKAYNVMAGADINYSKKIKSKNKNFKILSVGVFFPYRRYEDIIEAINTLKNEGILVNLTIVGKHNFSKKYSKKIKNIIAKNKLDEQILLKEFATDYELNNLYNSSNAFVFVNDAQTWGISVFEAIANGVPVIITNNIGAKDLLKNNHNSIIINPKSPLELKEAIKKIMDKKYADFISKNAKEILPQISWSAYAKRINKLIIK